LSPFPLDKAFEDCLNQQSALQAWNIKQRQEAPDAPSTLASRNNTKQHNTFKRLLHIPSSLHTTKIHYIDVKKKLNRTSFLFHHRKSDVLTESMVLV
jgi:hypothetical protein